MILVGISLLLIYKNNAYQHYVFLTSANSVSASINGLASNITDYFHLREVNNDLNERQALLETENANLRKQLQMAKEELANDSNRIRAFAGYKFITAHVISNSIYHPDNYITIEKGSADGIEPQMGVVDQNGIVGIVDAVGTHASRVISMLNSNFRLSCKVKGSNHFGTLVWDGKSPELATLTEMPSHVKFVRGDTIITSGYSAVFPPDIPVGTIQSGYRDKDGNFSSLQIKLFTDFTTITTVKVVNNPIRKEVQQLTQQKDSVK